MVSMSALNMPVPKHRAEIYAYYRLVFDDTGCPMKMTGQGLVFHPILAAYVISDYVREFTETNDHTYVERAEHVYFQAMRHTVDLHGASVFMYHPDSGLTNVPKPFYSALTQAWYIKALCELSRVSSLPLCESLSKIFMSLKIPIEDSGVLIKRDFGWIVEEYPHSPAFYTLNGWLTVLRWIVNNRGELEKCSIDYQDFITRNLDAVEHLLHYYDAPFCFNSRYQLMGFSRVKIVLDRPVAYQCHGFDVVIPGEGIFPGDLARIHENSRWGNYIERQERRIVQFNILMSLISRPEPNVFSAHFTVDDPCDAQVFLAKGDYRPDVSGMPTERWELIGQNRLAPGVQNHIVQELPFDSSNMFAYPTNFKKHIGDKHYNGYHFVHIIDLADLYLYSCRPLLKQYALLWLDYIDHWPTLPVLFDEKYSLESHIYKTGLREFVLRLLAN